MNKLQNTQTAGLRNAEEPGSASFNLQHQPTHFMNSHIYPTIDMSNMASTSLLAAGQVVCINCHAFFAPAGSPHCPSCGLHYQQMICMHCGECFPIPSGQMNQRDIECPHCRRLSYRPFCSEVTDYPLRTEYFELEERTEYTAFEVTDFPFGEDLLEKYPRLVQYDPSVPLGAERRLPYPAREYSFNLGSVLSLDYNKRVHVRGLGILCNTTNTPEGSRLRVCIRDRQNCLQVEDVITPAKGVKEFCLFNFGHEYRRFSRDICLSLWWEKEGSPLHKEVILLSTASSDIVRWEDKEGELFSPALILYSYVFDGVTRENSYVFTAYPTNYPTTEYPTTEYPTTEYPTTEYPTTEYPTTEYPTTEYPTTEYPVTNYPATEYPSPNINVPDSISFTLMEEGKNLWCQMGASGEVADLFDEALAYTPFPDESLKGKWMRVDSMDMAIPRAQFRYVNSMEVEVTLDGASAPFRVNSVWDTDQILRIDLALAGIPESSRTVPVSWGIIRIPSVNRFHVFCDRVSRNPIGAIFGSFVDSPARTSLRENKSAEGIFERTASVEEAITFENRLSVDAGLAAIPVVYQVTEYPTTDYATADYPTTAYPTDYVTNYPTTANGTNDPAARDSTPVTCYCFKDDGSCDDDELKAGAQGGDDPDDGDGGGGNGGGGGSGGGGGNGGGSGNGGSGVVNKPYPIINDSAASNPGLSVGYGKLPPGTHIEQHGSTVVVNFQKVYHVMSSPRSVGYSSVVERRVAGVNSPTGTVFDAKEVCIVNEKGYPRYSEFNKTDNKANPTDRTQTKKEQVEKVTITQPDGSGLPLKSSWFQETLEDGTVLRYSMQTGDVVAVKSSKGVWSTPQDWERSVRVIYENPDDPSGDAPTPSITNGIEYAVFKRPGNIRQIWSKRDGLMDITTQSARQYTMTWYALADVGSYNMNTKRYAIRAGAEPVKKWIVQSEFIDYTTKADGKKYEVGTNRLLSESDLELLRSYTVTELRGGERFVSRWEQPDSRTLVYTRGEGADAETVVTTRTATDPDTLANLRAEYKAIDMAYLRVGDTYTREVEEARAIPGVPGGVRVRYRRYPFGDVCTFREKGTGTSLARSVVYEYDTRPDSPTYGCCIKKRFSSGKIVEMAYDAKKRMIMKKTPWAGGTHKITRYTYCIQPEHPYRQASVTDALIVPANESFTGRSWEKPLSRKQYAYNETPALREEKVTQTAFSWQDFQRSIPSAPQVSLTQWYGTDSLANGAGTERAAGRLKMQRDASGMETHYRYHDSTKPGMAYSCTITHTTGGGGVPGKTTQTVHYYDDNDLEVSREEYVLTGQTYTLVDGVAYTRDEMRRVIRTDRANGSHTTTLWMCGGPVQETDENGVSTYYQYNSAKKLVSVTRESTPFTPTSSEAGVDLSRLPCRVVEYFYDAAGRPIRERTTIGQAVTSNLTEWDALNRVTSETDTGGRVTRYMYSSDGRTVTSTLPGGATLITLQHMDGSVLMEAGSGRQAQFYTYALLREGLKTTVRIQASNGPLARATYADGSGRTAIVMEPRGGDAMVARHILYDGKGRAVAERPGHLPGTRTEYDDFGRVVKQIRLQDPERENQITETTRTYVLKALTPDFLTENTPEWAGVPLVWEESSRRTYLGSGSDGIVTTRSWTLVSRTLPHVGHVSLTQNEAGMMSAEWTKNDSGNVFRYNALQAASGRTWTLSLDGKLFKQTDLTGDSRTWSYQYLAEGEKQSVTDTRGYTQTTQYDLEGRVRKQTDAAGNSSLYAYDVATGQLARVTHPDGKTTCYDRDQRGRIVAVYGTAVQPVRSEYDDAGRITALHTWRAPGFTLNTSPLLRSDGDITRWFYHAASGSLMQKQMADGKTISYYYDTTGNLMTKTHSRGVRIRYTYDLHSEQPMSIEYSDGTPGVSYTRNDWGQIATITDASGTRALIYDEQRNLTGESFSGACTGTLGYGTNEWGLPCGYDLTLDGTLRQELNGEYGGDLRLNRLQTRGDRQYTYTWKANSPFLDKLAYPNGITRDYTYDLQRGYLTDIRYRDPEANTLHTHAYSYDLMGRLTSRDSDAGTPRRHQYAYNDRGEVTGHNLTGGDQWTYSYDNIGNRLQSFRNTTSREYTTNTLNQYTRIDSSGSQGGETVIPAYDPDGNQTQVNTATGNWTVTWNAENRPIAFIRGDKRIECIYDHMGRRVQKTVLLKGIPVSCRRYVYKGYQLIAELDALDKSKTPQLVKSWTWDPTKAESATPLKASFWVDEVVETEYPATEYPITEYPTTAYPTTEYPETEYPITEYPNGHFFTTADLYWNEPRKNLRIHYQKNGQISLNLKDAIPEGAEICIDRMELAVKGEYPGWAQYEGQYKVEVWFDQANPMTVYAELDGDTLKIDVSGYYGNDNRKITTEGKIRMVVMGIPKNSEGNWIPVEVLPCYHDSTGSPLAHVSGLRTGTSGNSEYPTTEYPDNWMPTFFEPTPEDLIFRDTEERADINYVHSVYDQMEFHLNGTSAEDNPVVIDRIELALDNKGDGDGKINLVCLVHLEKTVEVIPEYIGGRFCLDVKKAEPAEGARILAGKLLIDFRKRNPQTGELETAKPIDLWWREFDAKPLLHVTGSRYMATTGYPTTDYPTEAYPTTDYPTTAYLTTDYSVASAPDNMVSLVKDMSAQCSSEPLNRMSGFKVEQPASLTPDSSSIMKTQTLSNNTVLLPSFTGGSAPVTRYDEEFYGNAYPETEDLPEVCPSFYGSTSDTVWMRNSKHNSLFQRGDSIRFPLSRELPQDKDLVVDCLEFFLHKARDTSGLTIELYLDNRKVVGIPYTFAGITRLDLKSLNISEKDRTLSYRKNLMVKFKKNGSSYGEMGIGYASPGLPAGHVKGRLQVRNRLLPQSTCQYLTDHNKNITGLADAQGKVVATWDYDAFGNIIQQTGMLANKNPLRFSSEYHDEDLGLIYYNYRHYNPKDGRWVSRDMIGENGSSSNLYSFVTNSPLFYVDNLGNSEEAPNSNDSGECKKKREKKKEKIDEIIAKSNPDEVFCTKNCTKISLLIAVSDPCKGKFSYGHAGMAIEDFYIDVGAKPNSLVVDEFWSKYSKNSLDKLIVDYIDVLANSPTLTVEFCVCRNQKKKILQRWSEIIKSLDRPIPPIWGVNITCSSAVIEALAGCSDPLITPDDIFFEIAPRLKNTCGDQLGKPPHIAYVK